MKQGLFMSSRAAMVKKCTKGCDAHAKLLFCYSTPIPCLTFSLPSLSWHLKLPNMKTRGGTDLLASF